MIPDFVGQSMDSLRAGYQLGAGIGSGLRQNRLDEEKRQREAQELERLQKQQAFENDIARQRLEMAQAQEGRVAETYQREDRLKGYTQNLLGLFALGEDELMDQQIPALVEAATQAGDDYGVKIFSEIQKRNGKDRTAFMLNGLNALSGNIKKTGDFAARLEKIDPDGYQPASVQKFLTSGNYADLQPKEDAKEKLEQQKLTLEQEKMRRQLAQETIDRQLKNQNRIGAMETAAVEAQNTIKNIDSLFVLDQKGQIDPAATAAKLDGIYGKYEPYVPRLLYSQESLNNMSVRDNISASLKLLSAEKLKGQGSVTENERKMLADAASILEKEDISPEMAMNELKRIRPIFEKFINSYNEAAQSYQQPQPQPQAQAFQPPAAGGMAPPGSPVSGPGGQAYNPQLNITPASQQGGGAMQSPTPQAIQYLMQNPTPQMKAYFQQKYGFLPQGL